jgi:uncharacterized protein DUF1266
MLRQNWGVDGVTRRKKAEQSRNTLDWLQGVGHRRELGEPADGEAFRDLFAWDMARLVHVARHAFHAGFLDESEAWSYIRPAARETQRHYPSWAEFPSFRPRTQPLGCWKMQRLTISRQVPAASSGTRSRRRPPRAMSACKSVSKMAPSRRFKPTRCHRNDLPADERCAAAKAMHVRALINPHPARASPSPPSPRFSGPSPAFAGPLQNLLSFEARYARSSG